LHRHDAAGIAAGGDDHTEIGARRRQRVRIDVGLGGRWRGSLVQAQLTTPSSPAERATAPQDQAGKAKFQLSTAKKGSVA
jgi:hypothetical protein